MAKGTYSGGSTTIRLGEEGKRWDGQDQAENEKQRPKILRGDNRRCVYRIPKPAHNGDEARQELRVN